jgi:hypothetical protein
MARVCDWKFALTVNQGRLVSVTPCFQSGPFDEERRSKLAAVSNNSCEVTSYTARHQAYEERATNSVVLEIQGSPQTQLAIQLVRPAKLSITRILQELASPAGSDVIFTGGFTSESMLLHRLVFADNYQTEFEFTDSSQRRGTDWYYTRVLQANGSLAWSSPIWVSQG